MRALKVSMVALVAIGNFGYSGGDISPVTDYEIGDRAVADEAAVPDYVEPIVTHDENIVSEYIPPEEPTTSTAEEYIEATPEPITPEPIITPPVAEYVEPVKATPMPTPIKTPKPPIATKPIATVSGKSGLYVGLGITGVRYKDSCHCKKNVKVTNKDTTYGIMGKVGYNLNRYIGVEARASKTNWRSDGSKVEHMGIYAKPMLPIGESSNLYGLVGMAKTKVKGSMPHLEHDGLALGGGVEVNLSQDIGVFVDYERMVAKTHAPRVHAVSAGVTYDF